MEEKSRSTCTRGYREIGYNPKKRGIEIKIIGETTIGYIDGVYLPYHDSEILLNVINHVVKHNNNVVDVVLELGSGTGYVTTKLLANSKARYAILIDVEPNAAYSSWMTLKINNLDDKADVVQCDGASCIRSHVVNIVYFNPPYLPVCDEIPEAIAWNGGEGGLEVWIKFFEDAFNVCRDRCFIIFVFSTLQKIDDIFNKVSVCKHMEIINCESFFYEMLCGAVVECPSRSRS